MINDAGALSPAELVAVTVCWLAPKLATAGVPVKFPLVSIESQAGPPLVNVNVREVILPDRQRLGRSNC